MKIVFHQNFERQYQRLHKSEKQKFKERLAIFIKDHFDLLLNNHPLRGKYKGYRSINVTGDVRAIYKEYQEDAFLFVAIDAHNKLYGG